MVQIGDQPIGFLFSVLLFCPFVVAAGGQWRGEHKDCAVWNPKPIPGESVTWSGGCVNGKAEGYGILRWFENSVETSRYEGALRGGKREGEGVYEWAGGDRYEGEFRDGRRTGLGVYHFVSGDRYEGEFRDGKRHGQGTYVFSNGERFEGPFWLGDRHGRGRCYVPGEGWELCRWRYDQRVP